MRKSLLGCLCAALSTVVLAAAVQGQERSLDRLSDRVDTLFVDLNDASSTTEAGQAFRRLLAKGPLEDRSDEVGNLARQHRKLTERYGDYLDAEQLAVKRFGDDLILLIYLYKTEKHPIIWRFAFYRSPAAADENAWTVVSLRFDTRVDLLFSTMEIPGR